ncbi:MAG TPA: hypothetical protein VER98_07500, partial [Terriglobia bacterium]|nr:hypothetical protein [Terriglobia bacterium]
MLTVGYRIWFAVLLVLAGFGFPSNLFAQGVLNIPRAVSIPDLFTGIAIGNPASTEVTATFTAYQADGTPLATAGNPVTLTIPAAGQIARNFGDLFGTKAPFNGWVQVTSAAGGLTGFFLNSNFALTDFDGSGVADPSAEFTLPLAASDGTSITELTLVNVNADSAMATLTLYGSDGSVLSTANAGLPGRGLIRQTLGALFGAQVDMTSASHIRISADRPIVGYEVVVNYLVSGNDVRRETASVSSQQMTPATSYVLPAFVTGGGWLSLLGLVNGAGVSQPVTLTAYKEDGTLWNSPSNPTRILLNGNGGLRTTVRELFGFPDDAVQTGWIQVTGSAGFLSSYVATGNTATPSFALVTGTDVAAASRY